MAGATLVGAVGQLYQGDLDAGRIALEQLGDCGAGVVVEDLGYGAVAVAQRLEEVAPSALILFGAAERGRPPAAVEARRIDMPSHAPERVHAAVREAITGYVTIDLVLEVAAGLGALPAHTVAVEIEPARVGPFVELSAPVRHAVPVLVDAVRHEVRRARCLCAPSGAPVARG